MGTEKSWLNKNEEETIKQSLLDFVQRVSSGSNASEAEIAILPQIVSLLLNNMTISDAVGVSL